MLKKSGLIISMMMVMISSCKEPPLLKPADLVFKPCSCDSATYCLTDDDVMKINAALSQD